MVRIMTAFIVLFSMLLIVPQQAEAARGRSYRHAQRHQRLYNRSFNRGYRNGRRDYRQHYRGNRYRNSYRYGNSRFYYRRGGYGVRTPNFGFYIR